MGYERSWVSRVMLKMDSKNHEKIIKISKKLYDCSISVNGAMDDIGID
jgi:hypothetical protein